MRLILFFTLFLVLGCTFEADCEVDEMGRVRSIPEQWGQEKIFLAGTWQANQVRGVLTRDQPREFINPQTTTLIAGVEERDDGALSGNYHLRWVLRSGTGGARTEVRFDAVGFTRIVLPVEAFSLGLVVEKMTGEVQEYPAGDINAFAYVGEGGLGQSSEQGPVYSSRFIVEPPNTSVLIPVPAGAAAVRILGREPGAANSPFATTVQVSFLNGSTIVARGPGLGAAPADPSFWTHFMSGNWFPLPTPCTNVRVLVSGGGTVVGFAQFKLDL